MIETSKLAVGDYQTDFVGEETKNFFVDKSDALDYIKLMELESQELDKT
jgi:hypothetical protein